MPELETDGKGFDEEIEDSGEPKQEEVMQVENPVAPSMDFMMPQISIDDVFDRSLLPGI